MARIRTINQGYDEIRQNDPNTAISKHAIRQAVLSGEIPSRRAGQKFLIDLDQVIQYFSGEDPLAGRESI